MKKYILLLLGAAFLLQGQSVVKNGSDPIHENSGRVITPKQVLRIAGEGEGYYMKSVRSLRCDTDGNIYINDTWSSNQEGHLLKFDGEGRFLKDLYRRGEGPGEIQSMYEFALEDDRIYAYDYIRRKVVVMDLEGSFIDEFKPEAGGFNDFYGLWGNDLIFLRKDYPPRERSAFYDMPHRLVLVGGDGKTTREIADLPNREFLLALGVGGGGRSWDPFNAVLSGGKIYLNRTREYRIEVLDLISGKILREFSRDYERVRHEERDYEAEFVKKYNAPRIRYETDIRNLYHDDGRLYVETSTREEGKGILFDVFDEKGRFLDSFFLDIEGYVVTFLDGFLYYGGSDEEGFPFVVKARLE